MRLIDADALEERAYEGGGFDYHHGVGWDDIADASTIDAVPVAHGRWERIPLNAPDDRYGMNKYNMRIKCTACGFVTSSDFIGFRYCPCCGAKMDAPDGGGV